VAVWLVKPLPKLLQFVSIRRHRRRRRPEEGVDIQICTFAHTHQSHESTPRSSQDYEDSTPVCLSYARTHLSSGGGRDFCNLLLLANGSRSGRAHPVVPCQSLFRLSCPHAALQRAVFATAACPRHPRQGPAPRCPRARHGHQRRAVPQPPAAESLRSETRRRFSPPAPGCRLATPHPRRPAAPLQGCCLRTLPMATSQVLANAAAQAPLHPWLPCPLRPWRRPCFSPLRCSCYLLPRKHMIPPERERCS
jgi:hypothetical protein